MIDSYFTINQYILGSYNDNIFAQRPKIETTSETKIEVSIVKKEVLELTKQEYKLEEKKEKLVINEKNEKTNLKIIQDQIQENIEKAEKLNEEMIEIQKNYDIYIKSNNENNQRIISLKAITERQIKRLDVLKDIKTDKDLIIKQIEKKQLEKVLLKNLNLLNGKNSKAQLLKQEINKFEFKKENKNQEISVNASKKNELNKRKQEKQQQINKLEDQKKALESQIESYSSQQKTQKLVVDKLTEKLK